MIVDLPGMTFIDCSTLTVLLRAWERARLAGGDLLLAGPCGQVRRILTLTGLIEVFAGDFTAVRDLVAEGRVAAAVPQAEGVTQGVPAPS